METAVMVAEQVVATPSPVIENKPYQSLYLVPILAVALLLRLLMALAMIERGANLWFYNQASELGCLAQSVIDGHGLASPFCGTTGPSAFLGPGYPLLVALSFRLFGSYSMGAAAMLVACQIVFGLLLIVSTMLVARRVFNNHVANVTGLICAFSPALTQLPVLFWETSFTALSLTSAVALGLHCIDRPKRSNWAWLGVLCGLSMLVNPALLLTLAAIVAVAVYRSPAMFRHASLVTLLTWTLVFAIWPIRNQIVLNTFVPLRTNLGYEFWQGNRPGANGEFSAELHPNLNRAEHMRYSQLGEVAYMHEKSTLAIAAVEADPTRFVELSLKRAARFWSGFTSKNGSTLLTLNLSMTSVFAAVGLVFLLIKNSGDTLLTGAPFLLFPLPYYLTHADCRFRLVLDPLAIMLSVYALESLYRIARDRWGSRDTMHENIDQQLRLGEKSIVSVV